METEQEKNTETNLSEQTPPSDHTNDGTPADPVLTENDQMPLLAPVPFYRNKQFLIKLFIVIVIILGGVYYAYTNDMFGKSVAEVNGMKITQVEYDESISLIEETAAQQGINLSDIGAEEAVKQQALDVLINNALLITAAEEYGIEVTQEEVDAKYTELVSQLGTPEELAAKMAEVGLTEEKLKDNIGDRVLADKYIEAATDIEDVQISDEEIDEFYATLLANNPDIPALEEIKEQMAAEMKAQKLQQIITTVLEDLRNEADIVINI